MADEKKKMKTGVYESLFTGNAFTYNEGEDTGYDLDMAEEFPLECLICCGYRWLRGIDE